MAATSRVKRPRGGATTSYVGTDSIGLTHENINPRVIETEYAVRGRLLERAKELEASGREICKCNIGNPQALGAKPLRWVRSVLSLCINRELLELAESGALPPDMYPPDVIARARLYIDSIGSVGAYSDSQGALIVRQEIAAFLRERDGIDSEAADVFLTDGASAGVRTLMQCIIGEQGVDAILAPSPVYPLYSALSTLMSGGEALYPLHESYDTGVWTIKIEDLENSLIEARNNGVRPRALVIINPGNPTGQCMSEVEVREVLEFAAREGLVLMADEVYQDNVYNQPGTTRLAHVSNHFNSFRRALAELRLAKPDLAKRVQLVTMHSTSKGYMGECGLRGGFFSLDGNWDAAVKAQLVKLASICLCSNVVGQLAMGLIVHPPKPGDPSYDLWHAERTEALESLRMRADRLANALDALPGVTCAPAEGALYLFPRVEIPIKAIAAARAAGVPPDEFYALKL